MIINLKHNIYITPNQTDSISLQEVLKEALFKSRDLDNARELYDKISEGEEVDLPVSEIAALQAAVDRIFLAGVRWQIDDLFNQKKQTKKEK